MKQCNDSAYQQHDEGSNYSEPDAVGGIGYGSNAYRANNLPKGNCSRIDAYGAAYERNREMLSEFVRANSFGIEYLAPQGTYLGWLDFRATKAATAPGEYLLGEGRVALSPGSDFGKPGAGWARLNFATQPEILEEIFDRITSAFK